MSILSEKPFSAGTLAERWGTSRQNIHNQINEGKIKNTFKVGKMVRIPAWEVERIESCGTMNQNSTAENTTQDRDQAKTPRENHCAPIDMMWQ